MKLRMDAAWGILALAALGALGVSASPQQSTDKGVVATAPATPPDEEHVALAGPGMGRFQFVAWMDGRDKVVTGAPFSADESTESTQVLADGNHIARQESSKTYRDSQGRRREERTLSMVGPWSASGTPPNLITIFDPVAGVRYMLHEEEKTAIRMPLRGRRGAEAMAHAKKMAGGGLSTEAGASAKPQVQRSEESLGTQVIEGVQAQGTRVTETIPAGAIGNEKPIVSVSERWYSPDLQTYVLTKHTDPRFGETVHKLTNINRDEPPEDLFQVPADYTVKDGPMGRAFFKQELPPPK